jgi:dienelactone hydrolase
VSYHGILTTAAPATPGGVKAEVAIYCGGRDPYVPAEHIEALRQELIQAEAALHITIFSDAEQAFTERDAAALGRPGLSHHAVADEVSWAGMMALLELRPRRAVTTVRFTDLPGPPSFSA